MSTHLKSVELKCNEYPCNDHYPFNLPLFHQTSNINFITPVTYFVGENGSGKSTMIEALAMSCGIHIWQNTERTKYKINPYEYDLPRYLKPEWTNGKVHGSFFGSDIFTHFTEILDSWASSDPGQLEYFGGRSLTTLSHGQSLMTFFRSRYLLKGLYFLDEPETALSPGTQLELLRLIEETSGKGLAQYIIATHSPILLSFADATIYSFDHASVQPIKFRETEHYRIYKEFMKDL
jgi:predicted ATPase